jgi:hypothetical protein
MVYTEKTRRSEREGKESHLASKESDNSLCQKRVMTLETKEKSSTLRE